MCCLNCRIEYLFHCDKFKPLTSSHHSTVVGRLAAVWAPSSCCRLLSFSSETGSNSLTPLITTPVDPVFSTLASHIDIYHDNIYTASPPYHISLNMMECMNMEDTSRAPDWVWCSILLNPSKGKHFLMDSWKEPIYRHEKRPVSTDFKWGSQEKQCAWPEKLKSVMHQLNSILSHEKENKKSRAGWKTRCVRIVCDWQRHWHTKYHSARKSTWG